MTRTVVLAVLLAAGPSPSPAPTPTALPTPTPERRDPRLIAALESRQGIGSERVALFDDGTLVRVRGYRAEQIVDRKAISPEEIDVVRRVCLEALAVRAKDVEDPGRSVLGDAQARRMTIEITDPAGGSRLYAYRRSHLSAAGGGESAGSSGGPPVPVREAGSRRDEVGHGGSEERRPFSGGGPTASGIASSTTTRWITTSSSRSSARTASRGATS